MGGSIAVTARRANGEVIRMCRWANPLPFFIQDSRWIDADEFHDNLVDLGFRFTPQESDLWGKFRNQWEDA